MRLVQTAVLATIITVASSVNVMAQETLRDVFDTGNALLEKCRDGSGFSQGFCMGYVVGVADVLTFHPIAGWSSCGPKEVTKGQVTDVVKAWLEMHPQDRHHVASSIVAEALAEAFPCKE